ncbi:MAG: hypothetical protein OXR07_05745 [Nitrospira sp.]|nr:hypothetical protein [Nitrospira sp.]
MARDRGSTLVACAQARVVTGSVKQAMAEHVRLLATKEDLAVLEADLCRVLWIQGGELIAAMGMLAAVARLV